MAKQNPKHASIAERLQTMLLEDYEKLLKEGAMTSTDRAALAKLLRDNGWNFDPDLMPEGLADKVNATRPEFEDDPVTDSELWGE